MKSILIFLCCVALAPMALAEQEGQGKKKKAGQGEHARQGQGKGQAQGKAHGQGQGQGGKHAAKGKTGMGNAGELNAGGGGQGGHGTKAARRAQRNVAKGQGNLPAVQGNGKGKAQIKHFDLAHSPNSKIETVKFKENNRIIGAESWRGEKYTVFRSYHSAWHDRVWWSNHYSRVVLIGGGWYYWNAGFWYPAWGYEPAQVYYPYDGPIYAYNDLPPDQVVANVQEALQGQGYYHGEVDGLLGPLTRAAIADYQRDHGLYTTSAIDEPTLASLGFA